MVGTSQYLGKRRQRKARQKEGKQTGWLVLEQSNAIGQRLLEGARTGGTASRTTISTLYLGNKTCILSRTAQPPIKLIGAM